MLAELMREDRRVNPIEWKIATIDHLPQALEHLGLVSGFVLKAEVVSSFHEAEHFDLRGHFPDLLRTRVPLLRGRCIFVLPRYSSTAEGQQSTRGKQSLNIDPCSAGTRAAPAAPPDRGARRHR